MAVKVVEKATGKTYSGKLADIKGGSVHLWSGSMSDKKGGFRGCGKKVGVFPEAGVSVSADDPSKEIKKV